MLAETGGVSYTAFREAVVQFMLSTSTATQATNGSPSVSIAGAPLAVIAKMLVFTVKVSAS